jgi:hypothetical protein
LIICPSSAREFRRQPAAAGGILPYRVEFHLA